MPTKNIIELSSLEGENKEFKDTQPFFPKRVVPVDISPHSLRCELVILLERLDMTKVPKPTRPARSTYFGRVVKTNRFSRGSEVRRMSNKRGLMRGMRGMPMRESMYPLPPREHLHLRRGRRVLPPHLLPRPDYAPLPRPMIPRPRRDFEYSDFRRDFEDAIDAYPPPPRGPVSRRLAMANAMLEKGLRLAEEAMADDYPPVPPTSSYVGRRGRAGLTVMAPPASRMGMDSHWGQESEVERGYWGRGDVDRDWAPKREPVRDWGLGGTASRGWSQEGYQGNDFSQGGNTGRDWNQGGNTGRDWNQSDNAVGREWGRGGNAAGREWGRGGNVAGMERGRGGKVAGRDWGQGINAHSDWSQRAETGRSWGGGDSFNDYGRESDNAWKTTWNGDNYDIIPPRSALPPPRPLRGASRGRRGFGGPAKGRGMRGQNNGGVWRR